MFDYEITVYVHVGPNGMSRHDVLTVRVSTDPDCMRNIVHRLRAGWPEKYYSVGVEIITVDRVRVSE